MGFRENLKAELLYQDILVKELAAAAGISKRTLDNYLREKGNIPPADVAVKIAKALNVSVEYLVTGEQDETRRTEERAAERILAGLAPREVSILSGIADVFRAHPSGSGTAQDAPPPGAQEIPAARR
ncbi:MAG: helix-turn-helix domain-containing protein [Treponemataceae bacterium]|nr:helix-turn-helix domain-containing protein [Treponemataceae bacterium]